MFIHDLHISIEFQMGILFKLFNRLTFRLTETVKMFQFLLLLLHELIKLHHFWNIPTLYYRKGLTIRRMQTLLGQARIQRVGWGWGLGRGGVWCGVVWGGVGIRESWLRVYIVYPACKQHRQKKQHNWYLRIVYTSLQIRIYKLNTPQNDAVCRPLFFVVGRGGRRGGVVVTVRQSPLFMGIYLNCFLYIISGIRLC